MRLSRAAQYGILACSQLTHLATVPPVPCSHLCKKGGMPERFLLQVLRTLVNNGILRSSRGVIGGYRLARPADEITVADIIAAIDGPIGAEPPALLRPLGTRGRSVEAALTTAGRVARDELAGVRLSQLLA